VIVSNAINHHKGLASTEKIRASALFYGKGGGTALAPGFSAQR
jgi:hypothetical protein